MRHVLTKSEALRLIIWILAFAAIVTVFPLRIWKQNFVTSAANKDTGEVWELNDRHNLVQSFVPMYDHLDAVEFLITDMEPYTWIDVRLKDSEGQIIVGESMEHRENDITLPHTLRIDLNARVTPGTIYFLELSTGIMSEAPDGTSGLCILSTGPEEDQETPLPALASVDRNSGEVKPAGDDNALVMDFIYTLPLGKAISLAVMAAIFCAAYFLTTVLKLLEKKYGVLDTLTTYFSAARAVILPAVALFSLYAFARCVVFHRYSVHLDDILVYAAGIIIFDLVVFYVLFGKGRDRLYAGELVRTNDWVPADLVFIVAVSGAMYWGIQYLNGVTDASHGESMRNLLIYFAVAMASTFFAGTFSPRVKINLPYTVFTVLFMAVWVIMRNGRMYPVVFSVILLLSAYRYVCWSRRKYYLRNIALAVVLNFVVCAIYCLIHRPYLSFTFARYPFVFASATEAAVYLTLVLVTAASLMLREEGRLHFLPQTLFGVSAAYLIFTSSRTGILTAAFTMVVLVFVMCRTSPGKVCRVILICLLTAVLSLPVVFTAQRILPAEAGSPVEIAYEKYPDEILRADNKASMWYITFGRFVQVFLQKMASVPEFTTDLDSIDIVSTDVGYIPEDLSDVSNGRVFIYSLYASGIEMQGHEGMGITTADGTYIYHAHNIYLQALWDYGIIVGTLFALWIAYTLFRAFRRACKSRDRGYGFALAVVLIFVVSGLFEWVSDPCNPVCFVFMQAVVPLFADEE
ncbi:MAG: O-antigen ligase family protein [Lachnospiraceae bacterium]|nr:O-antigen ligase family protein [Lachnospiraceae bacterium]